MRYRFEGFEFDARSGLLEPDGDGGGDRGGDHDGANGGARYLAPQPSLLLELLLESAPGLVSKQEIAKRLWPDVEVEVEQGLHHCVRQIRRALGDSAAEERFIRTIHRRGYSFVAPVKIVNERGENQEDGTRSAAARNRSTRRRKTVILVLLVLVPSIGVTVSTLLPRSSGVADPPESIRIAVMSFRPPDPLVRVPTVAERLVVRLTDSGGSQFEVVGPSTTTRFDARENGLSRLIEELEVDYILNGRFVPDSSGFVLAEVIRAEDGAHVWAEFIDLSMPDSIIAETIELAFRTRLDESRSR